MPKHTCQLTLTGACSVPPPPLQLTLTGETKPEIYEKIAFAMRTFAMAHILFPDQVQSSQVWKENTQ